MMSVQNYSRLEVLHRKFGACLPENAIYFAPKQHIFCLVGYCSPYLARLGYAVYIQLTNSRKLHEFHRTMLELKLHGLRFIEYLRMCGTVLKYLLTVVSPTIEKNYKEAIIVTEILAICLGNVMKLCKTGMSQIVGLWRYTAPIIYSLEFYA